MTGFKSYYEKRKSADWFEINSLHATSLQMKWN